MDIFDTLKKLQRIEADREYTKKSRRLILSVKRESAQTPFGLLGRLILQTFQFGSTIALAGLLLVLVVGGFTIGK